MSGTKDINWRSYVRQKDLLITRADYTPPPDLSKYDDSLKFSECENVEVNFFDKDTGEQGELEGGREDAIDAVRGNNYFFYGLYVKAKRTAITLKGSIDGWAVGRTKIKAGKGPDIEVGQFDNYWYPGRPPTRNGVLNQVSRDDGKAVIVRLWDATRPTVYAGNVRIQRVPKFVWYPYFRLMYLWVRFKRLKTT